jgi:hypothetical protein
MNEKLPNEIDDVASHPVSQLRTDVHRAFTIPNGDILTLAKDANMGFERITRDELVPYLGSSAVDAIAA